MGPCCKPCSTWVAAGWAARACAKAARGHKQVVWSAEDPKHRFRRADLDRASSSPRARACPGLVAACDTTPARPAPAAPARARAGALRTPCDARAHDGAARLGPALPQLGARGGELGARGGQLLGPGRARRVQLGGLGSRARGRLRLRHMLQRRELAQLFALAHLRPRPRPLAPRGAPGVSDWLGAALARQAGPAVWPDCALRSMLSASGPLRRTGLARLRQLAGSRTSRSSSCSSLARCCSRSRACRAALRDGICTGALVTSDPPTPRLKTGATGATGW